MDQHKNKNIVHSGPFQMDYDYETDNSDNSSIKTSRLQEDEENLTDEKLISAITNDFNTILQIRETKLEEIEDKIFKTQKLLHAVRYVQICSYYNNKSLEQEPETSSILDPTNILAGQNRLHPAVKKLIGKNPNNLSFFTARSKRKAAASQLLVNPQPKLKKIKLEEESNKELSEKHKIKQEPTVSSTEPEINRKRVQHKIVIGNISYYKKTLEQSKLTHKWMVYVQIFKGMKNGPEVTNSLVDKVVFYLHPSYKPHDLVDVSEPPFHLSRRGWGEFPLRVKVYFKSPMNKPVDVIHQLKLDKTFTERQTLGNQTTVSVFLYDDTFKVSKEDPTSTILTVSQENSKQNSETPENNNVVSIGTIGSLSTLKNSILNDPIISIESIKIEPSTSFEHDYCFDNVIIKEEFDVNHGLSIADLQKIDCGVINKAVKHEKVDYSLHDHVYSISPDKRGQKSPRKHKSPVKQAYNELIYGIGPHYLDPLRSRAKSSRTRVIDKVNSSPDNNDANFQYKILKTVTGQSIRLLPESFNQILLNNGNIVSVKILKSPSPSTKNSIRNQVLETSPVKRNSSSIRTLVRQEKELLKLPPQPFKSMGEVLPYLFKRLPLWSAQSINRDYKCTYPFTASSESEFVSWDVGKKLAAEWSRARIIKKILLGESYSKNWTTKAIFMYGRSHLYTPPVQSYRLFRPETVEKHLILNCYQIREIQNGCSTFPVPDSDEAINITSPTKFLKVIKDSGTMDTCEDISDKKLSLECAYIKEAALDVGVVLKPEVLCPGVFMNASERVMYEAVKCFAETLIRRSRNYLICQNDYGQRNYSDEFSEVTISEVNRVMDERMEFQKIKAFAKNKQLRDFFS